MNVPTPAVIDAYKEILASKYNPRAILYRLRYGLDDRAIPMAVMVTAPVVPVQKNDVAALSCRAT